MTPIHLHSPLEVQSIAGRSFIHITYMDLDLFNRKKNPNDRITVIRFHKLQIIDILCVTLYRFVYLVGFLTSSSTTRLYCGRAPRQSVWQFYVLPHMRQSWETMTSISAGHIILTPAQPVGSRRPQRGSNPGPPDQVSRALPTEPPRPPLCIERCEMLTVAKIQFLNTWQRGYLRVNTWQWGYLRAEEILQDIEQLWENNPMKWVRAPRGLPRMSN